jgi:hypothetical protein
VDKKAKKRHKREKKDKKEVRRRRRRLSTTLDDANARLTTTCVSVCPFTETSRARRRRR